MDQADLPEHLRDDAPYVQCSRCKRKSFAATAGSVGGFPAGAVCGFPQPDGENCPGTMLDAAMRARVDGIEEKKAEVLASLEHMFSQPPDVQQAAYVASSRERVEEINARPLEDRLEFLALLYRTNVEQVKESIGDVTFEFRSTEEQLELVAHCRYIRSIETIFITAKLSDATGKGEEVSYG